VLPRDRTARAAPTTIASRLDPAMLNLAGVGDLVEELLAALDSSAGRSKLVAAALAGLLLGGLLALSGLSGFGFGLSPPELGWPALLLLLPLGTVVVVEGGTYAMALAQWWRFVRQKPGRLLLAEGLALGTGLVLAVPLGLLLGALATRWPGTEFGLATALTLRVLAGLLGSVV